jgi:hypothetical protein
MSITDGCEWTVWTCPNWDDIQCDMPARFTLLNVDGAVFSLCAEHYDAALRGEYDEMTKYDDEPKLHWLNESGRPYEDSDFDEVEE